ncbi:MAG: RNA chaperone Hfq [Oscillospiraceae bacterium]|jgi:host factor-I protein|nr:RNA chaperone Hfq [Oscillospiraceae bacterium]
MQRTTNYQDLFLNQFRRDHQNVTVFLVNGFQIKGVVRAFDNFTVVMEADGRQQLIYKHAISTIIPLRPVPLPVESPAPQETPARPVG